jgi:S-adenosylmethionine hydrolase
VAVEVGDGQSILVGPDNGLLAPAVAMVGGATRAAVLTNDAFHLPAAGATFAGRDVFAPVAANLCLGADLAEVGDLVDPASLLPGVLPVAEASDGGLAGEVLWVDRFGNAQLNIDPEEVEALGERVTLRYGGGGRTRGARRVAAYDELSAGEVGLVTDSYGLPSVSVDRGSAAAELGLAAGDPVAVLPAAGGGGDSDGGGDTGAAPVALRRRDR